MILNKIFFFLYFLFLREYGGADPNDNSLGVLLTITPFSLLI